MSILKWFRKKKLYPVFCKQCWYQTVQTYPVTLVSGDCFSPEIVEKKLTPEGYIVKGGDRFEINKDNRCPYYRRAWYKAFDRGI